MGQVDALAARVSLGLLPGRVQVVVCNVSLWSESVMARQRLLSTKAYARRYAFIRSQVACAGASHSRHNCTWLRACELTGMTAALAQASEWWSSRIRGSVAS